MSLAAQSAGSSRVFQGGEPSGSGAQEAGGANLRVRQYRTIDYLIEVLLDIILAVTLYQY